MLLTSKTVRAQTRMILSASDSPVVQSEEEALWGRAYWPRPFSLSLGIGLYFTEDV